MSSQLRLSAYGALATMATATCLVSVFSSYAWVVPVMGAIVIVAGSCALVRYSPLPSAFEPIVAALAVLLWVTLLDARSKAHLGFVPGRLALRHLGHVARGGFTEVRKLPTPAPAHHGLVLLTVVGVAAVALVVDLMTVTLRRAALSGLPLLALFTVCAATGHHGIGVLAFVTSAVGYLWLLYADNREKVARWGAAVGTGSRARPASAWSTDTSSAPAPGSLGRRIGALAISLGVIVPLALPGLHTGIDKHGTGGGGDGSGSNVVTFNPIVQVGAYLRQTTAEPLFSYTYQPSTSDPGYLRMTSLDEFNGTGFSPPTLTGHPSEAASENLPVEAPPSGQSVTSSVTISSNFTVNWLPVPTTTLGVNVGDDWRYDPATATIFSASTTTAGLTYTTRSIPNEPTAEELNAAGPPDKAVVLSDMTKPDGISPAIYALTRKVTAHAVTSYQKALDIQNYFTTGHRFTYDTSIPPDTSPQALDHFLFRTHRGFCQQFATAMAAMARIADIPSRVAVGFTSGTPQPNGSWLVTGHDAHAWPELWFQGYGWIRFEPTPRGDGQAVTPAYATGLPGGGPNSKVKNPTPTTSPSAAAAGGKLPDGGRRERGGGSVAAAAPHSSGISAWTIVIAALALLLGVALIAPGVARELTRRRRWRQMADPVYGGGAAWAELRDMAIDRGLAWDDGRTPRQIGSELLSALGSNSMTAASLRRLAKCEEESRYAPTPPAPHADLRGDLMVVQSAMLVRRTRAQQLMSRVMPRSTLQVAKSKTARIGDWLDWFSHRGASWRGATRTRLRSNRRPAAGTQT